MKKHSTVKVVLITLLLFMLLTWILPVASFQSSYQEQGLVQMGLFDLFNYPLVALQYFGNIALFVLVVGGFYGILYRVEAYRKLLDNISNNLKKKGKLSIAIMMIVIATLTSICSLQVGMFIFVPFLVSIILLMGYDKIVAALTIIGSAVIGIAGSTFAYGNTSVIISILGTKLTTNILIKIIIAVLGLVVLLINTILYINKKEKNKSKVVKSTKKTETKSTKSSKTSKSKSNSVSKSAAKNEDVKVVKSEEDFGVLVPKANKTKSSVLPLSIILCLMFIITVLAYVSWSYGFNNSAFENATNAVVQFKLFGFPIFGKILGTVKAFGNWTLNDLITMMLVFAGLIMIIYKVKFQDAIEAFGEGAKKALEPAILVVLIYACLVATTYHPFQLTIYHFLFGLTKGFNLFTNVIASIFASLFNADPLYAFQSVLPYLQSIVTSKSAYGLISVVYPAFYGLTMLVAPTSVVLMLVLSFLGISYKEWFKNIWKLLLELLALFLIILIIAYIVIIVL